MGAERWPTNIGPQPTIALKTNAGPRGTGVVFLNSSSVISRWLNFYSPGCTTTGAPALASSELNTAFAPKCAGSGASNCSLR